MSILTYIILFTLIGSVFSLIGGIILLFKEKLAFKISHFLASFAAGTLLGASFFDLLPEALEAGEIRSVLFWVLAGILIFFLFERFIHWFHHHHEHVHKETPPTIPLVIFGDSVHNFIDGVAIAATFLTSIQLGIVTTLAVAAHEIPQEIGDFGILLHRGLAKNKVLFFNFASALTSLLGAIVTFLVGQTITNILPMLLAITAGFFIYIAASDLIPEIHHENRKGFAFVESVLLLIGVFTIGLFVSLLE